MNYNKAFFKKSNQTRLLTACIAALFLFTGTACASKAPVQPSQEPGTAAAPDASQTPEPVNPSETPQTPGTSPAPDASQAPEPANPSETLQTPGTSPAPDASQAPGSQPQAGSGGQISSEEARNAALSDSGIAASEATFVEEKLEYEDGITVYKLEFYTSTGEYEYEINASTGAIHSKSTESFPGGSTQHNSANHPHNNTASGSSSDIGMDNAKSTALSHAGLSADSVTFSKVEQDMDDGRLVYEIEFYCNGQEYEYELLASDGSILKYEVD